MERPDADPVVSRCGDQMGSVRGEQRTIHRSAMRQRVARRQRKHAFRENRQQPRARGDVIRTRTDRAGEPGEC